MKRRHGLAGSSMIVAPRDEARGNCMGYLGCLIDTCIAGRPDVYFYAAAVEALRGHHGLLKEMRPTLARARELAQGVWATHPNHPDQGTE